MSPVHSGCSTFLAKYPYINWLDLGAISHRRTPKPDRLILRHRFRGFNVISERWPDPSLVDGLVIVDPRVLKKRLTPKDFEENQAVASELIRVSRVYGIRVFGSFEEGIRSV